MAERKRLLELAITGLKHELLELEEELAGAIRTYGKAVAPALVTRRRKRRMSAAAKKAISMAQKARWAKRRQGTVSTAKKKVRKVSTAARKAAAERMREYWAKRKAAKK